MDGATSAGVDAGELAVLSYQRRGAALDVNPASDYPLDVAFGEYKVSSGATV